MSDTTTFDLNGQRVTLADLDDALKRAYAYRPHPQRNSTSDWCVLLAHEAGEVSEGVAADLLGTDRLGVREIRHHAIEHARALAGEAGRRRQARARARVARTEAPA